MSKASLGTGNGPGSSIALAPETIRVRDALIEKFSGAPLEEMNNFMTMALSNETDELRRLGILAARIYILRNRVDNLKEFNRNPSLTSLPALDTTTLSLNLPGAAETIMTDDGEATPEADQWSRIQMTEPGEVNGVRFLAGTIIDAQTYDADKLIHSGKAVRVDVDGNIIDHHDDDFNDSDTLWLIVMKLHRRLKMTHPRQQHQMMRQRLTSHRGRAMLRLMLMLRLMPRPRPTTVKQTIPQTKTQKHQLHDAQTAG